MDPACLPALAVIGRAVLPPSLAERYRLLERGELDEAAAEAVRGQLDELAGILDSRAGDSARGNLLGNEKCRVGG